MSQVLLGVLDSLSLSLIDHTLLHVGGYEENAAREYQQHVINTPSEDRGGDDKAQVSGFIKMHCFI